MIARLLRLAAWIAAFVIALIAINTLRSGNDSFNEIEWHGQKFALNKTYRDYDEYKDDTDQLASREVQRVRALLLSLPVPRHAPDREARINLVSQAGLRFPGYGSSYGGVDDENHRQYELEEFEIPQTGEVRSLVYRANPDGSWDLVFDGEIADRPMDAMPWTLAIRLEHGRLRKLRDGVVYVDVEVGSS